MNNISTLLYQFIHKYTNNKNILKVDINTIFCETLNISMSQLYISNDKILKNNEIMQITNKIKRLSTGEPLAYILGFKYFWEQKLFVNNSVLIPRADTEAIVEKSLEIAKSNFNTSKLNILDLGTGSGAIALAMAYELPQSNITAVDYSAQALEVARKNALENNISNVEFIQSDWYASLENKKFDIIISNPPYIDISDDEVDKSVFDNEPHSALFAKNNGLLDIEKILANAYKYLQPNGWVILEHGYNQGEDIFDIFRKNNFKNIDKILDFSGKYRGSFGQCR